IWSKRIEEGLSIPRGNCLELVDGPYIDAIMKTNGNTGLATCTRCDPELVKPVLETFSKF
ncbi:MAG TPA: hypothetical protein VKA49_00700, partial [Flavitalea sp.]|nr:hypothetical protein [Flavitalea sp.]